MTVLGSLTTRSRRTADRFAEASDRAGRARVRLPIPGHRPRAVHHPSDRGRLAASLRRSAGGSHRRWAAPRSTRADRTTGAELRHRFGVRIARLVETVSDDPSNLATRHANANVALASHTPIPTPPRSSPRTRSPRSESLRRYHPGNFTNPTSAPNSRTTAPASRCSAEPPGDVTLFDLLDTDLNQLIHPRPAEPQRQNGYDHHRPAVEDDVRTRPNLRTSRQLAILSPGPVSDASVGDRASDAISTLGPSGAAPYRRATEKSSTTDGS